MKHVRILGLIAVSAGVCGISALASAANTVPIDNLNLVEETSTPPSLDSERNVYRPAVGYYRPAAGYYRPAAGYYRPAAGYYRPAAGYYRPAAGYYRPAAGYYRPYRR
ncbi:putative secreted protein [Sorangium cellulosum So ce56]|uniref:Secreted protein n=1 Tax=Sorangium cellulosum (strain So ce56) TaxID=448385 RepID=A9FUC4_SORC5|nr:putative secreted protein [Sorangium cellulosum So ce56]